MELASLSIRIARSENLSALPQVMLSVIRKMSDPTVSSAELETIFRREPAIVAKLLKAANSSYYGLRHPVQSVSAAIAVLGMKAVGNIVISVAYQQTLASQHSKLFDRGSFWQHSLATGILARAIARKVSPECAEEYYMIGLLHDIGWLGLERHCPAELDKILTLVRQHSIPELKAQMSVLGFDTTDVGAVMATQWRLGDRMVNAIEHHGNPNAAEDHQNAAHILNVANGIAHQTGFPNQSPAESIEPDPGSIFNLDLQDEFLDELRGWIRSEVIETSKAYSLK
ncbi:MAG: HDOD domain-containing protein [Fimbriimonadales bacterium]|nr:HDOD domain-containing protein [Fimbriimonadales bacterium]